MLKTVDHRMMRPAGVDDMQLKTTLPLYFTVLFYFFKITVWKSFKVRVLFFAGKEHKLKATV